MAAPAPEVIPVVDLRLLSQAEINSLSLSWPNAFDLRRNDDVVVPKIDRSVFNESAGSRKQTYSRLRLDPHKPDPAAPSTVASRRPRGLFSPSPSSSRSSSSSAAAATFDSSLIETGTGDDDDSGHHENLRIVSYLRKLFAGKEPALQTQTLSAHIAAQGIPNGTNGSGPQVPVRAQPVPALVEGGDREVLNRKGESIDLNALRQKADPFAEELRRRTVGLTTEEQLLAFMSALNGQWGSRRRRRRIVDSSEFGDYLPRGWKLLLGLKRKDGEVWVYCCRYISPSGKQFPSCREVSSYILSLVGDPNIVQQVSVQTSAAEVTTYQENFVKEKPNFSVVAPLSSSSNDNEKKLLPFNVDDQYDFSCNQSYAKRRKLDKVISERVIVKDGKIECQICHKMFSERHRYYGHMGAHARYQGVGAEAQADDSSSAKFSNLATFMAVPYDLSLPETEETSTVKIPTELQIASTNLQYQEGNHGINHGPAEPQNSRLPSMEISNANTSTNGLYNSCTIGVDALMPPVIDRSHEKVSQENSIAFDSHHKPEDTTKTTDGKNIEAGNIINSEDCDLKNAAVCGLKTNSCDLSNVDASNTTDVEPSSVQVSAPGSNGYNSGTIDTTKDVNYSSHLDVKSSVLVGVTNSSCETVTEVSQFFPKSMSSDSKINNCDVTHFKQEKSTEVNSDMIVKAHDDSINSFSSLSSLNNTAADNSNEIDASCCASISETDKYAIAQKVDLENPLSTGNSSNYVIGVGDTNSYVNNAEENALVGPDKSSRKTDLASSHGFSEVIVDEGILPIELDASCINIPFESEPTSSNRSNNECAFDIETKDSMLGEMDVPVMQLDRCFNGSNISNEEAGTSVTVEDNDGNPVEIDFNLSSPWVHSSVHIPDVSMIPDQYEDGATAINQKEKLSGFAHLTLDTVESPELVHLGGQVSISMPEASLGLGYVPDLGNEGCSSVQLGWGISLQNTAYELRSVCVWCSREFDHVATSAEEESDTLGFICPDCKAKISCQFTVFNNQSSN